MMQVGEAIPPEVVRARIDDILERSEFETTPSMLEQFFTWLWDTLDLPSGGGAIVEPLLWTLVAVLMALLLWLVVRLISENARREARAAGAATMGGPTPRARALALRREGRAARAAGDLRLALRLQFFALVVGLGARGNLRYRDAWTNRELLDRGEPSPALRRLLSPLVAEFEAKDFGSEPTLPEDVDRVEALCDEHLGVLAEAVA